MEGLGRPQPSFRSRFRGAARAPGAASAPPHLQQLQFADERLQQRRLAREQQLPQLLQLRDLRADCGRWAGVGRSGGARAAATLGAGPPTVPYLAAGLARQLGAVERLHHILGDPRHPLFDAPLDQIAAQISGHRRLPGGAGPTQTRDVHLNERVYMAQAIRSRAVTETG
jgi:hypothetical protein